MSLDSKLVLVMTPSFDGDLKSVEINNKPLIQPFNIKHFYIGTDLESQKLGKSVIYLSRNKYGLSHLTSGTQT